MSFIQGCRGNKLQLTNSSINSWRPKNNQVKKIAFIRASGAQNHIYTMNPDGSGILKSLIQFLLRDLIQISLTIHGIHLEVRLFILISINYIELIMMVAD
jgi:hypothetical protein